MFLVLYLRLSEKSNTGRKQIWGSDQKIFFVRKWWGPLKMEIGWGPLGIALPDSRLLRAWADIADIAEIYSILIFWRQLLSIYFGRCRNIPAHISYQTNLCWHKNVLINLLIRQRIFCKNRIKIDSGDLKLCKTEDIGFIFTAFSHKRIDVYQRFTGYHFVELWCISFGQGHQLYWNFIL